LSASQSAESRRSASRSLGALDGPTWWVMPANRRFAPGPTVIIPDLAPE